MNGSRRAGKPWAERARVLLLEGLVIMASILAAFALDRWWEGQRERSEERATLAALHDDFTAARTELERRRVFHARIEAATRSTTLALHESRDRHENFAVVADTTLGLAYIAPTTQLGLGTARGLIQSGRLGILQDLALRKALSEWDGRLGELTEEEFRGHQYVHDHLDPVMRTRMDVSPFVGNRMAHLLLGREGPAPTGSSRVPVDYETIGVFSMRLFIMEHGSEEFDAVLAEVDRILGLVEAARAR